MPKKTPVTSAARKLRVQEVFEMILELKSTATIITHMKKKHGVTMNTVYDYITDANRLMKRHVKIKQEDALNKAIAQRETIVENLIIEGSFAAAAQALADKGKLEGLYEVEDKKTTVNIKVQQQ